MYLSAAKLVLLLSIVSASLPVFAKHKGDFVKTEEYCATDSWVFPIYEDIGNPDDNSKYFIPVISSQHQKYPLIFNVYDLTQVDKALPTTLRAVLINEVFMRKESVEQVYQDDLSRIGKGAISEKFKNSRLLGLFILDCVADRGSQNPSSNTDYNFIASKDLDAKFVTGLPYVNLMRARSTEKRFAESDMSYAIEFFDGDRTDQDAFIKDFNTFLSHQLTLCKNSASLMTTSPCLNHVSFPAIDGLKTSLKKEEL